MQNKYFSHECKIGIEKMPILHEKSPLVTPVTEELRGVRYLGEKLGWLVKPGFLIIDRSY
jgi:hypothetical protein